MCSGSRSDGAGRAAASTTVAVATTAIASGSGTTVTTASEQLRQQAAATGFATGVASVATTVMSMATGVATSVVVATGIAYLHPTSHRAADVFANLYWNSSAGLDWYTFGVAVRNLHGAGNRYALLHADGNRLADRDRNRLADRVGNTDADLFLLHHGNRDRHFTGEALHTLGHYWNAFDDVFSDHAGFAIVFCPSNVCTFLEGTARTSGCTSTSGTGSVSTGISEEATLAIRPGTVNLTGNVDLVDDVFRDHTGHGVRNATGFGVSDVTNYLHLDRFLNRFGDVAGYRNLFLNRSLLGNHTHFGAARFLRGDQAGAAQATTVATTEQATEEASAALLGAGVARISTRVAAAVATTVVVGTGVTGLAALFPNQLDALLAGDANWFANLFANRLADRLHLANWLADLLAYHLGDALFDWLADRHGAITVMGFANWLANGFAYIAGFADGMANLIVHGAALFFTHRAANDLGAFLVGRFADGLAFRDGPHFGLANRFANGANFIAVASFANGLVASLGDLSVFRLVHGLVAGANFVPVSGASYLLHLNVFHCLINSVDPLFGYGIVNRLIAARVA